MCFGIGVMISISLFPTGSVGFVKWMVLLGVVGVFRVGLGSLGFLSGSANYYSGLLFVALNEHLLL